MRIEDLQRIDRRVIFLILAVAILTREQPSMRHGTKTAQGVAKRPLRHYNRASR